MCKTSNCVLNKSCYLFWGKIVKQFALFSEKFTQLFKNFTRPPVAAVAPNINSEGRMVEVDGSSTELLFTCELNSEQGDQIRYGLDAESTR